MTPGVPQSSVLEAIFFLIYINNMADYTKYSSVRLFADYTTIYLTFTARNDCRNKKFHDDFPALERWEVDWLMEFYKDKSSIIRITSKKTIHRYPYTLHGQILTEEMKTKYLSITIADNIMWNTHIEQTAAKNMARIIINVFNYPNIR